MEMEKEWSPRDGVQPDPKVREMIADAAEAQEQFAPDVLEQYAREMRRKQGWPD